ncbi:MAG: cytochrome P450 [Vicinamibacterales bacterium]
MHRDVAHVMAGLERPVAAHFSVSGALQSFRATLTSALDRSDLVERSVLWIAQNASSADLDFEELVASTVPIVAAGHATTTNLIANGAWLLLSHPGQRFLITSDPADGWSLAIDEMLRFESPVQTVRRVATEALEVSGQRLEAGRELVLAIGKANRDPAAFRDPNRFDVRRSPNRHLGFGLGPHFCLGAQLARVQARAAFEALFSLPSLHAIDHEPRWMTSSASRGLERIQVEWDSDRVSDSASS